MFVKHILFIICSCVLSDFHNFSKIFLTHFFGIIMYLYNNMSTKFFVCLGKELSAELVEVSGIIKA